MVFNYNLPDDSESEEYWYQGAEILPTVSVKVHAGRRSANIRGIVTLTSEFNLISENCRKRFNLPLIGGGMPPVYAIGGHATEILGKSRIKFSSHFDEEHVIVLDVFVVDKINSAVSLPKLHPMIRASLSEFELADPFFDEPGDVDFLMGVTMCPLLLKDCRHTVPGTFCHVVESILGWIVVGRAPLETYQTEEEAIQSYYCTG